MTGDDPLTATRLDVAEMKGMLVQALAGHAERLAAVETALHAHESRLNEKKAMLARHDERLSDLEEDNTGRFTKWAATGGIILAVPGTALAIINFLRISGGLP